MTKVKKLLSIFKKKVEEKGSHADTALWYLLKDNEEYLPDVDGYFHKAFRQIDVTPSGKVDCAIWELLEGTDLFWEVFGTVMGQDKEQENNEK